MKIPHVPTLYLVAAAAGLALLLATRPKPAVPTKATNRAAEARRSDFRAQLWGREIPTEPGFWV